MASMTRSNLSVSLKGSSSAERKGINKLSSCKHKHLMLSDNCSTLWEIWRCESTNSKAFSIQRDSDNKLQKSCSFKSHAQTSATYLWPTTTSHIPRLQWSSHAVMYCNRDKNCQIMFQLHERKQYENQYKVDMPNLVIYLNWIPSGFGVAPR